MHPDIVLAHWILARLARCLPMDLNQRDALAALAARLLRGD